MTVWVNSAYGYCLGRFGRMGIDVHRPPDIKAGECLHCTHGPVTVEDWYVFVAKMKEHHGVTVLQRYMPKRFAHGCE